MSDDGSPLTNQAPIRSVPLDVLRAFAVLLVLWRHVPRALLAGDEVWHAVGRVLHRGGWVGVDMFFVLSGFLVSSILFREHQRFGAVRVGHFLIRRGFKIYPPFYFMIAVTAVHTWWWEGSVHWPDLAAELLFVQNMFFGMWDHTWTLAVEEHFYFFLAALVLVLLRRSPNDPFAILPRLCLWMVVSILTLRYSLGLVQAFAYRTHGLPTALRIDGMMFGVWLAYCFHYKPEAFARLADRGRGWWLPLGVVGLLPVFVFELETTRWIYTGGFTLNYLAAGALLVGLMTRDKAPGVAARTLARLGAYSYSIYLWQVPVAAWLLPGESSGKQGLLEPSWAWVVVYLIGSLVVGVALAKLIEVPVLALRDRWFPSRSGALRRAV